MIESSVVDLYVSINHQRQGAQQQWKGQSFRIECSCLCIATLLLQTFYFSLSGGTRARQQSKNMCFKKDLSSLVVVVRACIVCGDHVLLSLWLLVVLSFSLFWFVSGAKGETPRLFWLHNRTFQCRCGESSIIHTQCTCTYIFTQTTCVIFSVFTIF